MNQRATERGRESSENDMKHSDDSWLNPAFLIFHMLSYASIYTIYVCVSLPLLSIAYQWIWVNEFAFFSPLSSLPSYCFCFQFLLSPPNALISAPYILIFMFNESGLCLLQFKWYVTEPLMNSTTEWANEPKIYVECTHCMWVCFYCHLFNNSFNVEKYRKIAAAAIATRADISHTVNHLWHCNFNACLSLMNIEHKLASHFQNAVDHEPHITFVEFHVLFTQFFLVFV